LTLNKALGIVTLIAGGIILSLAANQGSVVTCGKWTGCTSHGDPPPDFVEVVPFFLAGGIGLVALGIFFLVSKQEGSKHPFGKTDQGMI
jgi:hypothetical protein